ncbi:MAG: glutamate--tRNA ligase [Candidatus Paceibacterota bacterium]
MNSDNKEVRVRFAPSPTGFLHVGGFRSALYNYLFAKQHKGTFILRIEDTDQNRLVEGATEGLINVFTNMGVHYDEGPMIEEGKLVAKGDFGPYIQSERLDLYKNHANELLSSGKAYRCFCTPERLEMVRAQMQRDKQPPKYDKHCLSLSTDEIEKRVAAGEKSVVRLNVDSERGEIAFTDHVRGEVKIHAREVDDQVLMKSDGFPTYHLASVVDDHLMKISHVIRADEWLVSTPKHILLYEAFGWEIPEFAHLPLLVNMERKKLSKRQGDVAVEDFLKAGYLPEALTNFVALLGWNPGEGETQEKFSLEELVDRFDLSRVQKGSAVFDVVKLDWLNNLYIRALDNKELVERVRKGFLSEHIESLSLMGVKDLSDEQYEKMAELAKERMKKLSEFFELSKFFWKAGEYEAADLVWKHSDAEKTLENMRAVEAILEGLDMSAFESVEALEKAVMPLADERGRGDVLWPVRYALSGQKASPSPFEIMWVLGKEESLLRLDLAISALSV